MLNLRSSQSVDEGGTVFTQGPLNFIHTNLLGDLGDSLEYNSDPGYSDDTSIRNSLVETSTPSDGTLTLTQSPKQYVR